MAKWTSLIAETIRTNFAPRRDSWRVRTFDKRPRTNAAAFRRASGQVTLLSQQIRSRFPLYTPHYTSPWCGTAIHQSVLSPMAANKDLPNRQGTRTLLSTRSTRYPGLSPTLHKPLEAHTQELNPSPELTVKNHTQSTRQSQPLGESFTPA